MDTRRVNSADTWRLGYRPALDGLRGVAVLIVVASHAGLPLGGLRGVDVFFALSGFLITSLLLEEHATRGSINLRRFYYRRALRLVPALVALVALVFALQAWFGLGSWWVTPRDGLAALTYTTNFHVTAGANNVLLHTWSLAMEEQFYLLWPLALLVLLPHWGRRGVIVLGAVLAVASTAWAVILAGPLDAGHWRLTTAPDVRATPILLGCALAAWMVSRERGRFVGRAPVVASVALAAVLASSVVVDAPWGSALTGVATVSLLWAVTCGPAFRPLEARWLRWAGVRSYGLYLYHYPIAWLVTPHELGAAWSLAIVLTVGTLLAAVSYRYVEAPFLRLKDRRPAAVERQAVPAA